MDFDSDYYSSRCKDINGLSVFKGTLMMFVGGTVIIQRYLFYHKGVVYSFGVETLFIQQCSVCDPAEYNWMKKI
jgi:hypothetical protein